jgi:hypothetical protein
VDVDVHVDDLDTRLLAPVRTSGVPSTASSLYVPHLFNEQAAPLATRRKAGPAFAAELEREQFLPAVCVAENVRAEFSIVTRGRGTSAVVRRRWRDG